MSDGSLLLLGIGGPELTPDEAARFRRLQPAGYILFSRNITSPQQTRKLTDDLRDLSHDLPVIAIDQEGGRVTRTREIAPPLPSAQALAAHGDMGLIADTAAHTADLLRLLGCNLNFAPVLDLDHFPADSNALTGRCWHRDPQRGADPASEVGVAEPGQHEREEGSGERAPHGRERGRSLAGHAAAAPLLASLPSKSPPFRRPGRP